MQLKKFNFNNNKIQIIDRNGEPWFIAKEVCKTLGLSNVGQAISKLEKEEKGIISNDTLKGKQKTSVVSESGLYALIFTSRKKEALDFQRWIRKEVLPSIRKTGSYKTPTQQHLLADSKENRKSLTNTWKNHGANKPHHYINLTRAEYSALFNDSKKKKTNMNKNELTKLSMLEFVEGLKLENQKDIIGYHKLKQSVNDTGLSINDMLIDIINKPVLLEKVVN